ncbi:hypothetical protein ALC60_04344 [Trachymyrmex zeteki]|uniref:Uncharacterized protein n=1 Tax=Mycetomoellerius zeteki TaxID=64791 RepID=A0A151X8P2_9HYME|nr:hypothetical protein ALC60_04344 [Trachymyrmex zeteki]
MRIDVPTRVNCDNGLSVGDRVPRNGSEAWNEPLGATTAAAQCWKIGVSEPPEGYESLGGALYACVITSSTT